MPSVIALRIGWNIHYMHSHSGEWLPETIISIAHLPIAYRGQDRRSASTISESTTPIPERTTPNRQATNNNDNNRHNLPSGPDENNDNYSTIGIYYRPRYRPPDEAEMRQFEGRRTSRRERTRPPAPRTLPDGDADRLLETEYWEMDQDPITVDPEPLWDDLCRDASLNSDSRVVISGLLSQSPAQAVALLLAHRCGVEDIVGVDPLFPNVRRARLEQMDDYRMLKRGIEDLKLVVPSALPSQRLPKSREGDGDAASAEIGDLFDEDGANVPPTHVIVVESNVPDLFSMMDDLRANHYISRYRLKLLNDALQSAASAASSAPSPTKFLHVQSASIAGHITSLLQSVLLTAYRGVHGFSVVQLELPLVFGPFATEGSDPDEFTLLDLSEEDVMATIFGDGNLDYQVYVEEAVAAVLQSLQFFGGWNALRVQTSLKEDLTNKKLSATTGKPLNLTAILEYRESETKSWLARNKYQHLGNAHIEAEYIGLFGVPRTRFPCSSKCASVECIPSAFEGIQSAAQEATEDCEHVLYMVDFTTGLRTLEYPRPESDGTTGSSALSDGRICRVAFVSGKSKLVRDIIRDAHGRHTEITLDLLQSENGKLVANDWRVVWLPEDTSETLSRSDRCRLRLDPAGMFAETVTRALYTHQTAFMKARISQLNDTFAEMTRSRIGKRTKKVRRPGTTVYQKVTIPAQKSRKVLFLAKEPKPKYRPRSLEDFVENYSEMDLSEKQLDLYRETTELVFSDAMKLKEDIVEDDPYKTFPYQWISPKFFVHDLTMKHSQDFRCSWYMEYLHWDDSSDGVDAELLSFAYIMGRGRLMGTIGERDEEATSWIPLLDPERPGRRLRNARGWELFIRIQS